MNRARDEFFASPAFTRNQNNCIIPRHLLNQTVDLFDPTALADDTLEIEIRIINSGGPLLQIELRARRNSSSSRSFSSTSFCLLMSSKIDT